MLKHLSSQFAKKKIDELGIKEANIDFYKITDDRGDCGFVTIIASNDVVYKIPLIEKGKEYLRNISNNHIMLQQMGVAVVPMDIVNGVGVMEKITEPTFVDYVKKSISLGDKDNVIRCLEKVQYDIWHSSVDSEIINPMFSDVMAQRCAALNVPVLKYGYPEMLPQNCFWDGVNIIWFDQETKYVGVPAVYIFTRFIRHLYYEVPSLHCFLPIQALKDKFHSSVGMFWDECSKIGYKQYVDEEYRINNNNIIKDLNNKIVIVGAGNWCMVFLDIIEQCGKLQSVHMILDNDRSKWGKKVNEIPIGSINDIFPRCTESTSVIIAIKNSDPVKKQLKQIKNKIDRVHLLTLDGYCVKFEGYEL